MVSEYISTMFCLTERTISAIQLIVSEPWLMFHRANTDCAKLTRNRHHSTWMIKAPMACMERAHQTNESKTITDSESGSCELGRHCPLFVSTGKLHLHAWFEKAKTLAIRVWVGTLFIEWYIYEIFPAKTKCSPRVFKYGANHSNKSSDEFVAVLYDINLYEYELAQS